MGTASGLQDRERSGGGWRRLCGLVNAPGAPERLTHGYGAEFLCILQDKAKGRNRGKNTPDVPCDAGTFSTATGRGPL